MRKVEPGTPPAAPDDAAAVEALLERVQPNTRRPSEDGVVRYRCQATELNAASTPLSTGDPRPYFRELTSTNVSVRTFARVIGRAAVMQPAHHFGLLKWPKGPHTKSPAAEVLDLQPGEWVRVKPREEIEATLTQGGANRGLHFDIEMVAYCDKVLQVRGRVTPARRADRRDARVHQRLHEARARRLLRRAQHRAVVLPPRDLPLLAGVLAGAGRRTGQRQLTDRTADAGEPGW